MAKESRAKKGAGQAGPPNANAPGKGVAQKTNLKGLKHHVYTKEDIAAVKVKMDEGFGYRRIFDHFVSDRKNGKTPAGLSDLKHLTK